MKTTQVARLVAFIRSHPECSADDIWQATRIAKYTSRISDARKQGFDIRCETRFDGQPGYRVVESRPITSGEPQVLGL